MEVMLWELVDKSKSGDQEALLQLIQAFNPLIKKLTRELGYQEAETDLIIGFIEIIKGINLNNFLIRSDGLVVNFIAKSLKNKKVDLFRKYVMNLKETLELNLDMILDESYYEHESKIFVEDLISYLPSLQRRVIKEKFLYGYSYKEIGDRLNISRQAVNGIKNRALSNLRKLI